MKQLSNEQLSLVTGGSDGLFEIKDSFLGINLKINFSLSKWDSSDSSEDDFVIWCSGF